MKALLVIDWQKEYTDKESDYFVHSSLVEETKRLNMLIGNARKRNFLIIFVRHNETEGTNFLKGSTNVELLDNLDIKETDEFIDKFQISSFYKTDLEEILEENNVTELYILGILTNLCVRSAISDAYDRGFNINVVEDLCISFNTEVQTFTLQDLKDTRPEIAIVYSNEI
jgi:nicotinamidase-related amidase